MKFCSFSYVFYVSSPISYQQGTLRFILQFFLTLICCNQMINFSNDIEYILPSWLNYVKSWKKNLLKSHFKCVRHENSYDCNDGFIFC